MNRNIVIGGIAAVAVLLGVAAWLLIGSKWMSSTAPQPVAENQGPIALNPVEVIIDHGAIESPDGRTLNITFPKFELNAKSGETTSAVFSTTWRLKLAPDERALVAVASINGFMKSVQTPAPVVAPAPAPATAPQPEAATAPATAPVADGSAPAAAPPAAPAEPVLAKPLAGDGVARVIVTLGRETSVSEWIDVTGEGAARKLSKAVAFPGVPADLRDGSTVPVTVTVELSGGSSGDASAKVAGIDLRLFAESAPLPQPEAQPAAATDGATSAPPDAGSPPPPPTGSGATAPPNPGSATP